MFLSEKRYMGRNMMVSTAEGIAVLSEHVNERLPFPVPGIKVRRTQG